MRFVYLTVWLAQGKTIWKQSQATLAEVDLVERQDDGRMFFENIVVCGECDEQAVVMRALVVR